MSGLLSVYVIEVFEATTGETLAFTTIVAPGMDVVETLAQEMCTAFNFGREVGFTDWRQIAEHPYHPGRTDAVPIGSGK
ncbi:hypothetical protein N7U49_21350 [Streptomyces sp. AD2-2]|nr:hypothetical protein N7U49_21350 [Streptomyces sp. AD2-2]